MTDTLDHLRMWQKLILNTTYGFSNPFPTSIPVQTKSTPITKNFYYRNFDLSDLSKRYRTVVKMVFSKLDETTPKIMRIKLDLINDLEFITKLLTNLRNHCENSRGEIVKSENFTSDMIIDEQFNSDVWYVGSTVTNVHQFVESYIDRTAPFKMCVFLYSNNKDKTINDYRKLANHLNRFHNKSILLIELEGVY